MIELNASVLNKSMERLWGRQTLCSVAVPTLALRMGISRTERRLHRGRLENNVIIHPLAVEHK